MAQSIDGVLQFQIFGIHLIGADICGFNRNTDEELCNRWMMLGAFLPFMRNHNTIGAIAQEPFRWDSVANASRIAIGKRYELLPSLYSHMARASESGEPAVRAVWYEFEEVFEQTRTTLTSSSSAMTSWLVRLSSRMSRRSRRCSESRGQVEKRV